VGTQVGLRETLIATALEMLEAQGEEPSLRGLWRGRLGCQPWPALSALPRQDRLDARRCRSWLRDPAKLEEALASGLVSAGEFDALVHPEAMLAPDD
jgi:hypothetical protein